MTSLKVAYVVGTLRPGGAERQMLALAERLPRDRFSVEFIEFSGPGTYVPRARAAGIRVRTLGALHPASGSGRQMWRRIGKTASYIRQVRRAHYDIVDAWLYPAYVLAAVLRHATGTPVIVAGRRNLGDLDDRFGPFEQLAQGIARRLTDAVVANSDAVAADAVARGGVDRASLRIIRNGVELIEPTGDDERTRLRAAWGIRPDALAVGCVANLREVKGHATLIRAFAEVAPITPIHLVLVGDGPLRGEIERQIAAAGLDHRVTMLGATLDPRPLYGSLDLVVQASRSEGLPNALLEAGAAGRAIVATAVGGTVEIVRHGETGLLVAPGDAAALGAAIKRLATDADLRQRLGRAAREHVAETFGMDRFVREFASLYEELAAAKRVLR